MKYISLLCLVGFISFSCISCTSTTEENKPISMGMGTISNYSAAEQLEQNDTYVPWWKKDGGAAEED